jgi:hypothetical protein
MATPYVISSDLVSAYPAKSLEIAQYIDGFKADLALVQNAQTGTTYTFVAADFTKLVTLSNASPVAVTLPDEATVPWSAGTTLRLLNQGAGLVTVAGAVGVTINGTPLTLAQYKGANLIKTGTDTWTFIPFASGVGAAVYSDANTGTYTGYAYKTYTASSTLTITTAGFADVFICAGGGGASNGAGGGGGCLAVTDAYFPVGTFTVTVGAGAPAPGTGSPSQIYPYAGVGGGRGGAGVGGDGGSGGGGAGLAGGSGLDGQGFAGATGGGGGGAGAVGSGATGGAGKASTLTNTSVTKGAGGSVPGALGGTNTGDGGGQGPAPSYTSFAGGSGYIEIRVAV